jgi:broad specificity phosphatase PhoE
MLRFLILALLALGAAPAVADEAAWAALRQGGHVVLLRHSATVPGVGDPTGFRLDDCATQRNLSDEGRAQAARIGAAFAARAVPVGRVLSSRWCRCLDTARLAFGGAEPAPALDSFFDDRSRRPAQTDAVRALVAAEPRNEGNLVLVTHNVNIAALTGIGPRTGEVLVFAREDNGGLRLVGRLLP